MAKKYAREPLTSLEDLRDDCIAVVINSGQSFKRVHEKGGPTPQTTSRWLYRETRFPQLATIRAILNACDYDLTIASKESPRIERINAVGAVTMPPKKGKTKMARRVGKANQQPATKSSGVRSAARNASAKRTAYRSKKGG